MSQTVADPAFKGVGQKVGLEIWRIEKLKPVPVDPKTYGTFCSGDSYIVLHTKKRGSALEWNIHFWLGKDTSQDEMGVAAYKTVELDDSLGGSPIQHREVQNHESAQFMGVFKNVTYLEGGVASGFRHVDPSAVEPRLFHLKGKRTVRVQQVEVSINSLNEGDVFILDMGDNIYQWNGPAANKFEKLKGLEMVTKLKEARGKAVPHFLDKADEAEAEPFWTALGGKDSIKSSQDGGADEEVKNQPVALHKISDASGKLQITPVASGKLSRTFLDTNDTFIVDTGACVYCWIGKGATRDEKKKGMVYAQEFLTKNNRPAWTSVTRVIEGGEPPAFQTLFSDWPQPTVSIMYAQNMPDAGAPPKEVKKDTSALYSGPVKTEVKMVDDGTGKIQCWRIENFEKVAVPKESYGQFFAGDSYIVLYEYLVKGKKKWILYFWQGRDSSQDEKGTSALMAVQMDDALGGDPVQVRVVQNKEPNHFLTLFKGKMVIHEGGHASAFKNRNDKDSYDTDGVSLFHIKGTTDFNTRAVQVEERSRSLNSADCFVLLTPSVMFVWYGKGSNAGERKCAKNIASILKFNRSLQEVDEGKESSAFWDALGGKTEYPSSKELQAAPREPRLFNCSNKTGEFVVEEIPEFSQDDLLEDDVMILDTYTEVFVWIGGEANDLEKKESLKAALDFIQKATDGRSKDTAVYKVDSGNEPPNFTCHFLGWNEDHAKDFQDPQLRRLAALRGKVDDAKTPQKSPRGVGSAERVTAADLAPASIDQSFPYEDLVNNKCNVDKSRKELYLSDSDFQRVFGKSKDEFAKQPRWKQIEQKKKVRLF